MPQDRFADRLDPATYEDDDEVVGVFESDPSETDALWLSARLFRRLTGVAQAYELHVLPLLDDPDPVRLNRARCEAVLDETQGSLDNSTAFSAVAPEFGNAQDPANKAEFLRNLGGHTALLDLLLQIGGQGQAQRLLGPIHIRRDGSKEDLEIAALQRRHYIRREFHVSRRKVVRFYRLQIRPMTVD